MKEELNKEVERAIKALCAKINRHNKRLLAIGFVTTDDVQTMGAKLLFEGDLLDDAEVYEKLSPVEWFSSEEEVFTELNLFLSSQKKLLQETESSYKDRVSNILDSFSTTLANIGIRKKFGESLYLTFAGVDPNTVLEEEEKLFVKRMNSNVVFEQWCSEFN